MVQILFRRCVSCGLGTTRAREKDKEEENLIEESRVSSEYMFVVPLNLPL